MQCLQNLVQKFHWNGEEGILNDNKLLTDFDRGVKPIWRYHVM
jgi:hypothetical protein